MNAISRNMFGQAGASLPPELMQAFSGIADQLQQRQQQINQPKKHPVLEALALTLLGGPGYAYGSHVGGNLARQRQSRQAELDALEALKALSYSVNQTNSARNDAGFNTLVRPLFDQAGLTNLPAQSDPANTLKLLGGLNAPAAMQMGNQQMQGSAEAGFNQGIDLIGLFAGAPKARPFPRREDVVTMRPDGGKVANQGGEKYQAPQRGGYEYAPMVGGDGAGFRQVAPQFTAEASKQLPVYVPEGLQATMIDAAQRAMTGASGQAPDFAKLPAELQALMALTAQRRSAESLNRTNARLAPALAQSLIGQRGASARASSAQAQASRAQAQATLAKLPAQIKELEASAQAKLANAEAQGNYQATNALKPFEAAYNQSLKEVKAVGLVNKQGKIMPKEAKTPEQQLALDRYQQRAQQYDKALQRLTSIAGGGQQQGQATQQGKKDYSNLWSN